VRFLRAHSSDISFGIVIVAVLLGLGGCNMLAAFGSAALLKAQRESPPRCSTP
jgi:hypothetical protein